MPVPQNLVHAARTFRSSRGISLLVVLILALGIGANTAIFTLLNAALFRPLPYHDSSALVSVAALDRSGDETNTCLSYPRYQLIAAHTRSYLSMAAFTNDTFAFTNGHDAITLQAARVSWNFFDVLGVKPQIGRTFLKDEGNAGGKPVALLSNDFWYRQFGGNRAIVGHPVTLDYESYTVIGVLPLSFRFAPLGNGIDIWVPRIDELSLASPQQVQGGTCYLDSVARLAPGFSLAQAQAEMRVLHREYLREYPKLGDADPKRPVEVVPLKTKLIGNFSATFRMLVTAVALVLLIACANAAGLLVTRALRRRREIAVRIALGAGRGQVIGQLLAESVFLALVGGIVGIVLSLMATRALAHVAAQQFPRFDELAPGLAGGIDWRVLGFALALSVLTGLLFGMAPALQFSSPNVISSLREEGRGSAGTPKRNFLRNLLVAGQMALSLVLLIGAGLLIRSFILLETQAPGFNPHGVLTMNIALSPGKYSHPEQMINFFDEIVQRVEGLRGVRACAVSSALPLNPARLAPVLVEGQPEVPLAQRPILVLQTFTSGYLRAMQIPLLKGRFLNEYDRRDSLPVVVVNDAFARKFFRDQDAVGKHIWIGRRTAPAQIVGVIGNIKNVSLATEPDPEIDLPFSQLPWARMNLIVRASGDPKTLTSAIRRQIAKTDVDQPVTAVRTVDELLSDARTQPRLIMLLLVGFAGFAFILAMVGLYGAISYSVAQRMQEMGVRIAVGAAPGDLLRLVVGQSAVVAFAGIVLGLAISLFLTDALENLVYGIGTRDPITFCAIPVLVFLCALAASYSPARRAMRVNVTDALRS